jgi:hypothetical protein
MFREAAMLWYNNPEGVRAIHGSKVDTTMSTQSRLMRLVRNHTHA